MHTLAKSLRDNGITTAWDPDEPVAGNSGPAIINAGDKLVLIERVDWRGRSVWMVATYDRSHTVSEVFAGKGTYKELFTCLYWDGLMSHLSHCKTN